MPLFRGICLGRLTYSQVDYFICLCIGSGSVADGHCNCNRFTFTPVIRVWRFCCRCCCCCCRIQPAYAIWLYITVALATAPTQTVAIPLYICEWGLKFQRTFENTQSSSITATTVDAVCNLFMISMVLGISTHNHRLEILVAGVQFKPYSQCTLRWENRAVPCRAELSWAKATE